jgi:hypothetical protein
LKQVGLDVVVQPVEPGGAVWVPEAVRGEVGAVHEDPVMDPAAFVVGVAAEGVEGDEAGGQIGKTEGWGQEGQQE